MQSINKRAITVSAVINAPVEKVWQFWTEPQHIMRWNNASDDWHTPYADNDVRKGGKFKSTMAAKDNSMSFDFEGIYTDVEEQKRIMYQLADSREVAVEFTGEGNKTTIKESFDPEKENTVELQRSGWQAILDNFKKYVEENTK